MIYLDKNLDVYYENGVRLGVIVEDVDGFYYIFFNQNQGGHWDESVLRQIADLLGLINAPWEKQIQDDPIISANS